MSAGAEIGLDAALIDAYRMGLEQGLNAGLSAAASAIIAHERKQATAKADAVETAVIEIVGFHDAASYAIAILDSTRRRVREFLDTSPVLQVADTDPAARAISDLNAGASALARPFVTPAETRGFSARLREAGQMIVKCARGRLQRRRDPRPDQAHGA